MAVSDLIDDVDQGELALPEFQRRFLWRPPAVADLLRTVARKWPCGTFLLLAVEDKPDFAFKPLEGAPKATKPRVLILDGQQRSTALYQSMTEKAEETYYIEMGAVRESGEFEDEHLKYLKNSRFTKLYPNVQSLAKARVVKVAMLSSDRQSTGGFGTRVRKRSSVSWSSCELVRAKTCISRSAPRAQSRLQVLVQSAMWKAQ